MNKLNNKTFVIASYLLAFIAFSVYLVNVARYSSRMPLWDDFDAVLVFLKVYLSSPDQQWQILTYLHNEHRLVFSRLLIIADYKLNGHVDLLHLIWLGNAAWVSCIGMLWLYVRRHGTTFSEFVPVVIVLLTFSHGELMVWAMASSQQYFQLAFGIGAILLLTSGWLAPALVLFVVASFTGGGGLLLAPVFGGYHLFKRQWTALAISSVVILLTAYVYFIGLPYAKPSHHPITASPLLLIRYMLTFLGSAGRTPWGCYVVAVAMVYFILQNRRELWVRMPVLGWLAIYIVLTALVAGITRAGFGVAQARSTRYTEYSLLMLAIVYLGYLSAATAPQLKMRVATVGLVISTMLFGYWYSIERPMMKATFKALESGALLYPDVDRAKVMFKQACDTGLLSPSVCAKGRN